MCLLITVNQSITDYCLLFDRNIYLLSHSLATNLQMDDEIGISLPALNGRPYKAMSSVVHISVCS